jgi:hypothetical protein
MRRATALAILLCLASPGASAQDRTHPPAWDMRLTLYEHDRIMGFAGWVAYEGSETTITHRGSTPYPASVAVAPGGVSKPSESTTRLDLKARPFRHRGDLVLSVELDLQYIPNMNRYRTDTLIEELQTNGQFMSGGDFVGRRVGEGWAFDLSLQAEEGWRAEVTAEPVRFVEWDERKKGLDASPESPPAQQQP